MTETEDKIRSAAEQNARLLKTLTETDYSVSACQQSKLYLTNLKKQIADEELKLKDLAQIVASEYAEHKKYRDSHMRRFAFRLSGKKEKFAETATKEEKEWLDAVQHELIAKKGLEQLKLNLVVAQRTHTDLLSVASVRHETQTELDVLYKSIFDGPSPEIPGEDEKENAVYQAESQFNVVQLKLSTEAQAMSILLDADMFLQRAIEDIYSALRANSADCWGMGDTFAAMSESSSLSRCQVHVSQVEMLIRQARRIQPGIRNIGGMEVAQMNFVGDVIFDNVFSDLDMRNKLYASEQKLIMAHRSLTDELHLETERQKKVQSELNQAKLLLDTRRKELQQVRAAAFALIVGGRSAGQEQPPIYEAEPPGYKAWDFDRDWLERLDFISVHSSGLRKLLERLGDCLQNCRLLRIIVLLLDSVNLEQITVERNSFMKKIGNIPSFLGALTKRAEIHVEQVHTNEWY